MGTLRGRVKRVPLAEFASVRPSGLIAINLEKGDKLGWVHLTHGNDEVILVSEKGKALRFSEEAVRPMGRQAGGVTGMRLDHDDRIASMDIVEPGGELFQVTTEGYGKHTPLDEYPAKGRATGGVSTIDQKALDKTGRIAAARVVQAADDITIITTGGLILRTKVKDIRQAGRATRGSCLIDLHDGNQVASVARISAAELRRVGASENGNGNS